MRSVKPRRGLAVLASTLLTFSAGAVMMAAPAAAATADLGAYVVVFDNDEDVEVGQPVEMFVNVVNDGPDTVRTAAVVDFDGPIGTITLLDPGCTQTAPDQVVCGYYDLPPDTGSPFDMEFTATEPGVITVTSSYAIGDHDDPNPSNDTNSETTTFVAPSTDVAASLTDTPDPVLAGDPVTYTGTVSNNGPVAADAVVASIEASGAGATLGTVTPSQGTCSPSGGGYSCNLGAVAADDDVTITATATPTTAGTVTSQLTVSSQQPDPAPGNNTATAQTTVNPSDADVAVTLGASAGLLAPSIDYALTIGNEGPADVQSSTVTVQLPTAVASVTNLPSGCTYAAATDKVTCSTGAITNGASVARTFRGNLALLSLGPLPATATRTASSPSDNNAANDSDSADCTAVTSLIVTCS